MSDTKSLAVPRQRIRRSVRIRGAVQGVGFRPFVWSLANEMGLSGWVRNDQEGVLLEIEGSDQQVGQFLKALAGRAPPLSRIESIEFRDLVPDGGGNFEIRQSQAGASAATMITPDVATCQACLEEIFTPGNRRHLYAFTNCIHCGPRYTITRRLPYDRAQTSMADFVMCAHCQAEYENPADRRFHAQPNACPACGPRLSMAPVEIVDRLRDGQILAIKGVGGFHLAVDAHNKLAVSRLRQRKQRDGKPFAVMVANLESARRFADITPLEAEQLTDRRRPVVICRSHKTRGLAGGISNGLPTIGLMLPYAPHHHLIFHAARDCPTGTQWLREPHDFALVMTSANPGGEPLVTSNEEAVTVLGPIADAIVSHDRDIVIRCDDSVVRLINHAPVYLRRARGFVPDPIPLPREVPCVLAVGGHLKNTICMTRGREAFLSQHIGDLDNASTFRFFRETIDHLTSILEVRPEKVACDLHPDFLSTRYGEETGLPLIRVQHHHAHIAATAVEHDIDGPCLGLALDGFGLGADQRSGWGGEFLRVDGARSQRLGHLATLRMPGGDAAAMEPWRMGAAALHALGRSHEITRRFAGTKGAELVRHMLEHDTHSPRTSSAGRLFDAACGLLGIRSVSRFEGEAAMALEALVVTPRIMQGGWHLGQDGTLDFLPLLAALSSMEAREGAEFFHGTLASAIAAACQHFIRTHGLPPHVLAGGGCFQNKVLVECLAADFESLGMQLLLPLRTPVNDGGLSLGQAWIASQTVPSEEA